MMKLVRLSGVSRIAWLVLCSEMLLISAVAHQPEQPIAPGRRSEAAPRAVTPFNSFDFGEVYTGETISQIFVIRNEGDADLVIKDFRGG